MRLEKQREDEVRRRKGTTGKTILATIWLGLCFAAAYYFIGWLFETGELTPNFFWNQLFIPRQINEDWLQILAAIVIVVVMNFFVLLGFGFSSRTGRIRPGTPSLKSRNPDPLDKRY
jgi:ABC-type Na+ efflux pump permease subunit